MSDYLSWIFSSAVAGKDANAGSLTRPALANLATSVVCVSIFSFLMCVCTDWQRCNIIEQFSVCSSNYFFSFDRF